MHAYRARGHQNNALWLVYSVKMDRDFILPSDRQLIHWIHFLETDPNVESFDLTPEAIVSTDAEETRGTELDATVVLRTGQKEWHEVKSADEEIAPGKSQLQAQTAAAAGNAISYRTFSDKDIIPHVVIALRWLKAIAYATVLRDQSHHRVVFALHSAIRNTEAGDILQLVNELKEFEQPIVLGLIARLAIHNHIRLDLSKCSFGMSSAWRLPGE
jgi:hypothetical protein